MSFSHQYQQNEHNLEGVYHCRINIRITEEAVIQQEVLVLDDFHTGLWLHEVDTSAREQNECHSFKRRSKHPADQD